MTSANPLYAGLAKPAQRALANAGIKSLAQLAKKTEAEIAALHGMGPNAIATLKRALAANRLSFSRGRAK
jgi:predicted Fe-Mo cluster-binding NifX family protein